ncbi:monovalent cation/H+ antiporter subunit D family protein [Geoalkalibacter halelectricus]|uniref:Monovalent cation/H+ antiporter subunit D family protein n=1 Tax=Geoalkalibacter halelectricus TaxID=2847045 RepID=A0ABY5ZJL6_9BACT|nr:monovalent cation/H+ antiporter subunit D family protein [Geoalkalibacter halelectricus]MDO3378313.1 monovalent cation/H+ antiporter subunit D family protein [Geoalkalibacter halelectricus]UWZ79318.1 monovalent cation/H+ antiporter subunit D family protein [Geoalkalibacter halelectricus]
MDLHPSFWPLAAVLISLLGAIPIMLSGRNPNVREGWTLIIAVGKFLIVASMLPTVLAGGGFVFTLVEAFPGVPIQLRVDPMGMFFALIASFLWILTSIYSIGYMRSLEEHDQTRYFASFAVAIGATIGVAFSANLLTLYLFYEVLSLSTYPLVAHERNAESRASGRRYLTFLLGASIAFALPGMLLCYSLVGTLDFTQGGIVAGAASPGVLGLMLVMLVAGFAKAGIMPFHPWLPAAMVAPTPVSSFLHGVAVVKVGVFSIVRVLLDIFGLDVLGTLSVGALLPYFVSLTIIVASLIALTQDNLKRRLAYSTVGQLSYIILGVSMLAPAAVTGGIMHIASHAFGKVTLFYCAGAIYVAAHKKYISQMSGLGRVMPFTFGAFALASLTMIGAPPTAGFVSKWLMLNGALDSDQLALLAVLLSSTLLNAAYFVPIVYQGFFGKPSEEVAAISGIKEAPLTLVVPLCLTATISLLIGLYPYFFLNLAQLVVP